MGIQRQEKLGRENRKDLGNFAQITKPAAISHDSNALDSRSNKNLDREK